MVLISVEETQRDTITQQTFKSKIKKKFSLLDGQNQKNFLIRVQTLVVQSILNEDSDDVYVDEEGLCKQMLVEQYCNAEFYSMYDKKLTQKQSQQHTEKNFDRNTMGTINNFKTINNINNFFEWENEDQQIQVLVNQRIKDGNKPDNVLVKQSHNRILIKSHVAKLKTNTSEPTWTKLCIEHVTKPMKQNNNTIDEDKIRQICVETKKQQRVQELTNQVGIEVGVLVDQQVTLPKIITNLNPQKYPELTSFITMKYRGLIEEKGIIHELSHMDDYEQQKKY